MATINDMHFGSEDEEHDEDYDVSEGEAAESGLEASEEGATAKKKAKKKRRCGGWKAGSAEAATSKTTDIQATIRKQKVESLYREMQEQATRDMQSKRLDLTPSDKFMLQFQVRRADTHTKRNVTVEALQRHLSISVGRLSEEPLPDMKEFKAKCRDEIDESVSAKLDDAVSDAVHNADEVQVNKTVRFAGKTFTVQQTMSRHSSAYQHYERTKASEKRKEAGGQFAALDQYLKGLDAPTSINSIQKSEADWLKYKEDAGLSNALQSSRGQGFLERRAFLHAADVKSYEKELEVKRRRRIQEGGIV